MDDFNCLNVSNASKEFHCSLKPCSEDTKHLDEPKPKTLASFISAMVNIWNCEAFSETQLEFSIFNPDVWHLVYLA